MLMSILKLFSVFIFKNWGSHSEYSNESLTCSSSSFLYPNKISFFWKSEIYFNSDLFLKDILIFMFLSSRNFYLLFHFYYCLFKGNILAPVGALLEGSRSAIFYDFSNIFMALKIFEIMLSSNEFIVFQTFQILS